MRAQLSQLDRWLLGQLPAAPLTSMQPGTQCSGMGSCKDRGPGQLQRLERRIYQPQDSHGPRTIAHTTGQQPRSTTGSQLLLLASPPSHPAPSPSCAAPPPLMAGLLTRRGVPPSPRPAAQGYATEQDCCSNAYLPWGFSDCTPAGPPPGVGARSRLSNKSPPPAKKAAKSPPPPPPAVASKKKAPPPLKSTKTAVSSEWPGWAAAAGGLVAPGCLVVRWRWWRSLCRCCPGPGPGPGPGRCWMVLGSAHWCRLVQSGAPKSRLVQIGAPADWCT
jgi:hypothetical protein